jgi:AcrR family transcriptional regulator
MEKHSGIKLALIEAAGELFAENGLESTSVRAIVKKAGTALSAVNYHFHSKEQLYADCIAYVIDGKINLSGLFKETFEDNTQKGTAELIRQFVTKLFEAFLTPETKRWYGLLIMRARSELHPKSRSVLIEVTVPEQFQKYLVENIQGLSGDDAWFWVLMLISTLEHYVIAKETVLLTFDAEDYTADFIARVSDYTVKSMIKILGI